MRDFTLPPALEAHEPPARRDGVRLLAGTSDGVTHLPFTGLPELLRPGDLLVVNTSPTLPAAVRLDRIALHFSGPLPPQASGEDAWLVELRLRTGEATVPYDGGRCGEWFPLPGGATLTLLGRQTPRLWRARLDTAVVPYLRRYGVPIRYAYVGRDWPLSAYQTVFGTPGLDGGSAEMPSAGRPFSPRVLAGLAAAGVGLVTLTLHTGVASLEAGETPLPERYRVPAATAAAVNATRAAGGRIVAVGTTVTRALETVAEPDGSVRPGTGWTDLVLGPDRRARTVDGLVTGWHEPDASHLLLLEAVAGRALVEHAYGAALAARYLWHEFGDTCVLLPGDGRDD
jgi:S-adenosylmethionine:tRNA ribosyltransferase-isomerase